MKKLPVQDRLVKGLESFADALERGEKLDERFASRKVVLNLEPTHYDPKMVREVRQMLGMSQAIFSQFLGVSPKTVQAWEQGDNQPSPMACRFMDEIRNAPDRFKKRVLELVSEKST